MPKVLLPRPSISISDQTPGSDKFGYKEKLIRPNHVAPGLNNDTAHSVTQSISVSTSHSGSSRPLTTTQVAAGLMPEKASPCAFATSGQSSTLHIIIRVRITPSTDPPSDSKACREISKQRFAWPKASPLHTVLPSSPSGAVPATAIKLPIRQAREKLNVSSKGEPEPDVFLFMVLCLLLGEFSLSGHALKQLLTL